MSSQEDINPDSSPDSPGFNKDLLFDPKPKPKIIRVLTVMAYALSVSMAAIMLSIYYIFMWDGRPHIGARRAGGPESGSFSSPHHFAETIENITEHDHYTPSPNFIHFIKRNSSAKMEKWIVETPVEQSEGNISSTSLSTDTVENNTTDNSTYYGSTEMQQQFTDGESEALKLLPASQTKTTTEDSSSENTTWQQDYDTLEDFSGASPFMKKLMDRRYEDY